MKRAFLLLCACALPSFADEPQKTRDQLVLEDRGAYAESDVWVYNNLEEAFAEAVKVKKPLMVVHRCIP